MTDHISPINATHLSVAKIFSDDFETKRGRNTFAITQTVIGRKTKNQKWTPKVLEKRQRKILKRFAQSWDMETILEEFENS